jgi:glycosyltransferase involved in cell wall biosynthesis
MKISFIIPLHNEEKNASAAIQRIITYGKKKKWKFEIIPVNDRSTDNTKIILSSLEKKYSNVYPVSRKNTKEEQGNTMGKALQDGTKKAKGDLIIWTMGDLADDVETYGAIVEKIREGYDMVFGSRYMPGGSRGNLDALKAFLSSWGTRLARVLFGVQVHDITNAFRGFKKEMYNNLKLDSSGFSISPEFAIKAHLAGYKLGEVPTVYTNRIEGVSNFKLYKMTKSYIQLFLNLFFTYKIYHKSFGFIKK